MIYTITFNPAVDLVMKLPTVDLGELNRSVGEEYVAGGKGINISVVLKRLGHDNIATGFLGGFSGEFIKSELKFEKITPHFIPIEGMTRINVKLKGELETEINGNGPVAGNLAFNQLLAYFEEELKEDDVVFMAGNAAPGMDSSAYVTIAKLCLKKQAKLVLDTNKTLLTECLAQQPFIIKPNHHELSEIFNIELKTEADIIRYARKLQSDGARNVLVSLGGDGAILVTETDEVFRSSVPKGVVLNSVGAGDSMLAGFMAKFIESEDYEASLRQGAATGSATAFSIGIATKEMIHTLIPQVDVNRLY